MLDLSQAQPHSGLCSLCGLLRALASNPPCSNLQAGLVCTLFHQPRPQAGRIQGPAHQQSRHACGSYLQDQREAAGLLTHGWGGHREPFVGQQKVSDTLWSFQELCVS